MYGVLNINKPAGMTSHDVVQRVRRMMKERRVGHTGTLDPSATGVLVLCIGKATRIAQYLEAGEKEYRAVMRLGVTTDTLDADGQVLETRCHLPPDRSMVLQALQQFTGSMMQTPPAYSAVKVQGVPSYKLARQGKAEPLKPRQITVHAIDLASYEHPFVTLDVRCSKGVYIRTLCADIGEALGCGAHLTGLVRTRSGTFALSEAVSLDTIEFLSEQGKLQEVVVTLERALEDIPSITVEDEAARKILHGNRIRAPEGTLQRENRLVRVHGLDGTLLALAREKGEELRPETVLS
jgi:tRNA pseudouridine55 synthase